MTTQTIIWTAVPAGVDGNGNYHLSIHVSPRLVPNNPSGQLSEFPDFVSWPSTVLSGVVVSFGNGFSTPASVVTSPAADANRWNDLFSSTTPVRGRAFEDYTQRRIRSYSVGNVIRHLHDSYALFAATSGDTFPTVQQLAPFVGPLHPEIIEGKRAVIEQDIAPPSYVIPNKSPGSDPSYDFAELQRFHVPPAVIMPGTGPSFPQVDFHDMLSYAQDHPALMRLLRLVIDVQLLEPPPAAFTTVRVRISWNASVAGTVNVFPLTECSVTGTDFRAIPLGGDLQGGYYRLDDTTRFGVAPVDQDGGGLKALNFAAEIDRAVVNKPSVDTPSTWALPAMRATGLAVFRNDRATNLRNTKFVRGLNTLDANLLSGNIPGDNVLLFADDLVQGGRFDAIDPSIGVWRSLSARSGNLLFKSSNTNVAVQYDEAPSNAAAGGAHDNSSTDLYLGETVLTWNGWSLGAPRPGMFADGSDGSLHQHDNSADPSGMQLVISYAAAPGSLPRLRFGRHYRLRARAVDIAGNSVPVADPSAAHAAPSTLFGRLDPVQSPALLLRTPLAPSDAVERVVLRSNYNTNPSPATAERHVLAPKVSQRMAELHGMFDTNANPSVIDANAYNLIASRESKQVSDLPSAQPDPSGQPDVFYFDVNGLTAPYLPDPVATGVLFRGIGITPAQNLTVPFTGSWPAIDGVRVVAQQRAGNAPDFQYDAQNSVVYVNLDKAERRKVRVSSVPDAQAILEFLLWQWVIDVNGASPQLQAAVTSGAHWMFTPFRDVTLVHAVKQPLLPPNFVQISASRNAGDTFATLNATPPGSFSRASTARVDFEASWPEFVDDGPGSLPPTRPDPNNPAAFLSQPINTAIALSMPIAETPQFGPPDQLFLAEAPAPGPRHQFGDTKHRDVTYAARAYSRFDEFFRANGAVNFGANNANNPVLLDSNGVVTGSVRLTSIVGGSTVAWVEGADFSVDAVAGTVSRSPITATSMPDVVSGSWVPRPNDRPTSAPVLTHVPASARPDAPKLVYAVPTFGWQASGSGSHQTRTRLGGGVRIYLDRPWWSSGGGELLGVVLANSGSGQNPLPDDVALVATQWGIDAVHNGGATPNVPDVTMFPRRVASSSFVVAPENPGASLSVAGHTVDYDPVRSLWFCDIDVTLGTTWMPFVRLALARYQPSAIAQMSLSSVVLADFVQLAANRAATVMPTGVAHQYAVQLSGPSYDTTPQDALGPHATVRLQQRLPGFQAADPLGWKNVSTVKLTPQVLAGPAVVYSGKLVIGNAVFAAGCRLLFEEFEQVRIDGLAASNPVYGDRPVYADTLVLS